MKKPKILTTEIVERFLKDKDSVTNDPSPVDLMRNWTLDQRLEKFTSIEDAAAQALANHKGSLYLNQLESVSIAAAISLAKVKPLKGEFNNCIRLDSLSLTPKVAAQLAEYRGGQLCFHCTSVDLSTIQAFRPFGGQLWLGNVTHLNDKTAAELASRSGGAYLDGLTVYNADSGTFQLAQSLCKWNKGDWLGLRGAKNIAPEVMDIFATFDGTKIYASDEIVKQLKAVRLASVKATIRENRLRQPKEWQNARIVLSKAPMKPLKGRNAERSKAEDASWWLPKKVCDWFVHKLDDAHKTSLRGADYGSGKSAYISPEAAMLLLEKADAWLWLMKSEVKGDQAKEAFRIQSLATLKAPKQFKDGKVSLPAPKKPLSKAFCWKPDFEGEDYHSVLHYYGYLAIEHVGSIEDPNGYPAKAMSPEAADLYRRQRAFWEAKHAEAKVAMKVRKQEGEQRVEKAAKTAGLSRKELEAKLERLSELVAQGNLKLVADMIAGFGEPWLYEAMLAGASITPQGDQKPGKVLKRFKEQAKLIMVLAMAFMPEGVEVDPSIRTDAPVSVTVTAENVDLVAESIAPQLPNLKPCMQGLEDLESLLPTTATFLVRHERVLYLQGLQKLGISEARTLSSLEGDIYLDGLRQIDPGVAEALARVKGTLSLCGLSSVSEQVARELGSHVGDLSLNLKELPESIAASLACCKGDLELRGLNTITPSAAAELAKHCGKLTLGSIFDSSSGLRLGADAAECLARHSGPVELPNLYRVPAKDPVGVKRLTLVKAKGKLVKYGKSGYIYCDVFKNFTHIDDDAAAFLGAQTIDPPMLQLGGLVTISPSAAASLGALAGKSCVELSGKCELTDEAAEAMAPFKNHFFYLGDVASRILAKARKRLKNKKR